MSNIRTLKDLESQPYQPFGVRGSYDNSGSGSSGAVTCLQTVFPGFKYKSFTFIATIVQVSIFILCEIYAWFLKEHASAYTCVLYKLGSKYTPAIVVNFHLHRLFLPIFLHGGFSHILFNMISQWFYGFFLEDRYGTKRFVTLYLLAGVGGNLLSAAFRVYGTSIGASSSLFGLIAFQCAYLFENWDKLGPAKNRAVIWLAIILISNISNATQNNNTDHHGHLGKHKLRRFIHVFVGGFIIGALIAVQIIQYEADSK